MVGSSDDGRHGRIAVGSTADWLLHSSPVPVAIAPRGYRPTRGCAVSRVTCAYAATRGAAAVLRLAATFSARSGARLRIATFGVRGRTMYPPEVGLRVEDQVLDQWREQAVRAQGEALKELGQEELLPSGTVTEVGVGDNWTEALEDLAWLPDEVLLIGSSARRTDLPGVPGLPSDQDRPALTGARRGRAVRGDRRGGRGAARGLRRCRTEVSPDEGLAGRRVGVVSRR